MTKVWNLTCILLIVLSVSCSLPCSGHLVTFCPFRSSLNFLCNLYVYVFYCLEVYSSQSALVVGFCVVGVAFLQFLFICWETISSRVWYSSVAGISTLVSLTSVRWFSHLQYRLEKFILLDCCNLLAYIQDVPAFMAKILLSPMRYDLNFSVWIMTYPQLQEEPALAKISRDSTKITVEQVHGLMSQVWLVLFWLSLVHVLTNGLSLFSFTYN